MPLKEEIFARMDELTPAERKVARSLLASYPSAGLGSAATLAKAAGTSTPTVLRLVTRLGIGSYPDFQQRLRDEITHHMNSPVTRTARSRETAEDGELFARSAAAGCSSSRASRTPCRRASSTAPCSCWRGSPSTS
jgi:DNA-binding MurR/RpiR family transcriptional regulator